MQSFSKHVPSKYDTVLEIRECIMSKFSGEKKLQNKEIHRPELRSPKTKLLIRKAHKRIKLLSSYPVILIEGLGFQT